MKQKIHYLFMLLLMMIIGVGGVKAQAVTWVKTAAADLQTDDVVVIVDQTSARAMSNNNGTSSAPTATPVTLNADNSEITSEVAATLQWVVTVDEGSYKFNVPNSENYLYCTNTNNGVRVGSGANYFFDIDGNYLKISVSNTSGRTTTRYVGVYNDQDWRCYENTTGNIKSTVTAFYKKVESGSSAVATTLTIDASGITNTDVYTSKTAGQLTATVNAGQTTIDGASVTWESSNENVATIDASGNVTLVAAGTTTITATYAGNNDYQASSATYKLAVIDSTPFEGVIFKAAKDKDEKNTATGSGSIVKDNVNFSCTSGILGNGSEYRMYKNSTVTISTTDGSLITKIEFTGVSGYPASGFGNQTGWSTSGYNGIWTGEAKSVSFDASGAQVRATEIKVTVAENSDPSITADNVEILYDAKSGSISYSIEKPVDGGILTASTEDTWLTLGDVTADAVLFTTPVNEVFTTRTASVTLTYTYGNNKTVTKEVTITQAGNPNAPGTKSNPYTVAQALDADPVNGVYVTGIVSSVVSTSVNNGQIRYYISDDGTENGNKLNVYNGKGLNNEDFTSIEGLQVGDVVVIYGNLSVYQNVNQLAAGNYLISQTRKPVPTLSFREEAYSVVKNGSLTITAETNSAGTISYESSDPDVAEIDASTGVVTAKAAGTTTITATVAATDIYKAATATVELTVTAPKHKATFYQNGEKLSEAEFTEDATIEFPEVTATIFGKQFVGWLPAEIEGTTNEASPIKAATMGTADVTYYAVYANVTAGTATNTVDELTRETTGVEDQTEQGTKPYSEWSGKKATSDAIYAGQSAGDKNSIQLRSNNSNSGVISTTSGGRLKKVLVTWHDETAAGRTLNVYGSNTAYISASDLYDDSKQGTLLGTIVKGTSTELAIDGDYAYVGLRSASGAMYLTSISITWENTPATYSDYCTTVVAPVKPAKPIVFHDGGKYEGTLTVAMAGEGTIKYTLNDNGETKDYTAPFTISETTTIKAWTEQNGAKSDEVEKTFTIVEKAKGAVVEDGYYTIQTNDDDGKYVNVAGRKTVTLVNDTKSAGTVIRVKADEDGVKVLRSQAVDLPRYAERAMSYVPEIVKEVVKKLAANVDDPIIGEQGADLILDKFKKEFDYHLYLEGENNTYRIYGRTPSMKPVVDFYAENKELVDSRLPKLEGFVEEILLKVAERLQHPDSDWAKKFKVHNIWALIVNEENKLTEPVDEASTAKFFTEVLSSEANIWNFAHETAMIYWTKVEQLINNPDPDSEYADMLENLGDYKKYLEKVPNIRPNFKYYIVPGENGVDIISEGNSQITDASTAWKLTKRDGFDVTFDATLSKNNGKEMYKTLYVDFGYKLPDGVTALKVTAIDENTGVAKTEEIGQEVAPQTPVLLKSDKAGDITLTIGDNFGSAVTDNQLVGADYLINKYEINTPQVESIFTLLANLSKSLADEYSYLKRKNAGTVNNKYFFGLTKDDLKLCYYLNDNEEKDCVVRSLSMGDKKLGFYDNWEAKANEAFLVSEQFNPVKLMLKGDVNRDGSITIADVTALVNIILGKATEGDTHNYDFEAAHVNADEDITIADVTALVNIILGK